MAKKSTQKKTSLEPSEVFCAVGLLMPSDNMRKLVTDQTGVKLLQWASSDGEQLSGKITNLDNRFKAMFKKAGILKRGDDKRSDMVANIVAGFSGALVSKAFIENICDVVPGGIVDLITMILLFPVGI